MSAFCTEYSDLRLKNLETSLCLIPGYQQLKDSVGPIKYSIGNCTFGAYSDLSNNNICLDSKLFNGSLPSSNAVQGALFEIANLYQKKEFERLVGRIDFLSPDAFVAMHERIEHRSALFCKTVLRRFLPNEKWPEFSMAYTTENFHLHYLLQQLAGHSQNVFKKYRAQFDPGMEYLGSLLTPVKEEEVKYLRQFVELIIMMEDSDHPLCKKAAQYYLLMKAAAEANQVLPKQLLEHFQEIEMFRTIDTDPLSCASSSDSLSTFPELSVSR
ncbi:MAG: hypothetical protein KF898_07770 [Parachlamydiales bacterium]|nr:hypothetical protein [Candidatus Acheromyda pituitae]